MKRRLLPLLLFIAALPLLVTAQTPRYARVISENANLRDTPSATSATAFILHHNVGIMKSYSEVSQLDFLTGFDQSIAA